ncbi:hypothetical protein Rsub_12553 [Raphidocelis subcapitata]|uniref:Uncharacterized protein n=1 Tax=Raphidocelis subcapitata TaxID=307507 RepID=A0A2V0PP58_9CHLO|nr:hypothetical protein Rsub_12553 [Raphidocelis subcapitata]|eukprot:GBF99800.1 hypothetical protein Rsub_12553 [Raphidocelis subcapitata]
MSRKPVCARHLRTHARDSSFFNAGNTKWIKTGKYLELALEELEATDPATRRQIEERPDLRGWALCPLSHAELCRQSQPPAPSPSPSPRAPPPPPPPRDRPARAARAPARYDDEDTRPPQRWVREWTPDLDKAREATLDDQDVWHIVPDCIGGAPVADNLRAMSRRFNRRVGLASGAASAVAFGVEAVARALYASFVFREVQVDEDGRNELVAIARAWERQGEAAGMERGGVLPGLGALPPNLSDAQRELMDALLAARKAAAPPPPAAAAAAAAAAGAALAAPAAPPPPPPPRQLPQLLPQPPPPPAAAAAAAGAGAAAAAAALAAPAAPPPPPPPQQQP